MTVWAAITVGLVMWLVWDEISDARETEQGPPVTIVGGSDPWDDYVLMLRPGDVIVADDGVEYEVTEQWPADAIVKTLADVNRLPEIAA